MSARTGAQFADYAALEAHTGSAIVRLNRAVAVAEVAGPGGASRCSMGSMTCSRTVTVSP